MGQAARLVLADGSVFEGQTWGAPGVAVGEAVFHTGMTGYQEVITDPSYCRQIVTMTAAQLGNTGMNEEDDEAARPFLAGLVLHRPPERTSNWRASETLQAALTRRGIVALAEVDTRRLTRHLRDAGAQMAAMGTESIEVLHAQAQKAAPMQGSNLAEEVSTQTRYVWQRGSGRWAPAMPANGAPFRVVALDFGIKHGILRSLVDHGCEAVVLPATSTAEAVLAEQPDGIFLSNGPGDPEAVTTAIDTVRDLLGHRPIFGICLGHQLLCHALGARTYKLKFGHHGLNHPVRDIATGRIEITSQNHGFAVDSQSLPRLCNLSHENLNDGTCEGIEAPEADAFSVQYHPEAAAGPHDARHLFARFVRRMQAFRAAAR